jgi:hypothetical protein
VLIGTLAPACAANGPASASQAVDHVLLISVDGLHAADLDWYVGSHPGSTLARLARQGRSYASARTPYPSDSVPGLLAQLTGGLPAQTGVYYDDSYSRALLPAGTTRCDGVSGGAEVALVGSLDRDPKRLDAGQGIAGLYEDLARIGALTGRPAELLDPQRLPVDRETCTPLLPHRYLRVNTVFDVAHQHGLRTAWADKHPAYEILEGPGGDGVDDLFAPEIDASRRDPAGPEGAGPGFPDDNTATQFYDALKVQAVLNWIAGKDHGGVHGFAVPAILGMNFQAVSTAQKLNHSDYYDDPGDPSTLLHGGLGGYTGGGTQPGPVLQGALRFVDQQLSRLVAAIDPGHTVLILSAKHGQSPRDRRRLLLIDDRAMLEALDGAWAARTGAPGKPLVAHAVDDDGVLLWLNDRSSTACRFAAQFLAHYSGFGIASGEQGEAVQRPFRSGGLQRVYAGAAAARFLGAYPDDERVPDVVGIAAPGSVWAGRKFSKIAEHGGAAADDRHVPILVWGAGIAPGRLTQAVQTTQIAPSILALLGLPIDELQATRFGLVRSLPGLPVRH